MSDSEKSIFWTFKLFWAFSVLYKIDLLHGIYNLLRSIKVAQKEKFEADNLLQEQYFHSENLMSEIRFRCDELLEKCNRTKLEAMTNKSSILSILPEYDQRINLSDK